VICSLIFLTNLRESRRKQRGVREPTVKKKRLEESSWTSAVRILQTREGAVKKTRESQQRGRQR